VESGEVDEVKVEAMAVVDDWSYAERMCADRVSNPHGEHAEGFFEVEVEASRGSEERAQGAESA